MEATQANILSSLEIKGASSVGGSSSAGCVPVLDENGLLSASMIPVSSLSVDMDPLGSVAFVDPKATDGGNGSVAKPFRTIYSASKEGFRNFLLVPGEYGSDSLVSSNTEAVAHCVFCMGKASFDKLTISAIAAGSSFFLCNLNVTDLVFDMTLTSDAYLFGHGEYTDIRGSVNDTEEYLNLHVYPEISIAGTTSGVKSTLYPATGSQIANPSGEVVADTVTAAIDRLGKRSIRFNRFSADGKTGIALEDYDKIDVVKSDEGDYYAFEAEFKSLVEAVNAGLYKKDDSPSFKDIAAESATFSGKIEAEDSISTSITLKNGSDSTKTAKMVIDDDNFLTIA